AGGEVNRKPTGKALHIRNTDNMTTGTPPVTDTPEAHLASEAAGSAAPVSPPAWVDYEGMLERIPCGIWLATCPSVELLGTEGDSPRGRIYLMRALAEGRTELNPSLVHHLDTCLGCRACESACPSAVRYGELLTQVRDHIDEQYPRPAREKLAKKLLL